MDDGNDLDRAAIARLLRLGGDRFLKQILDLFLQQARATIAAADAAHASADLAGVERAVHSLKSSAGNVGARAVQDLAGTIELLAESSAGEKVGPLLRDLRAAFERLEPHLEHLTKEPGS
jgi:HPt (histidine-containing phosphotransfer) domain-containing protein